MSDLNGDTAPNIRGAMRVMHQELRRVKQMGRRLRRGSLVKGPRRYCSICGKTFDFATVDPKEQLVGDLCPDCKQLLAQGYTACVTSDKYAFIKSKHLQESGLNGKIVTMNAENFAAIEKKYGVS